MLIDFRELFPRYNIKPKGVLHVGANVGEEAPVYLELGIKKQVWIEANPEIHEKLKTNISGNPEAIAYNFAAGDENKTVTLHKANNAGQSSSILELGTHAQQHPEVHFIGDIEVPMFRIGDFFRKVDNDPKYDISSCDFLNMDIQGAELKALHGIGDMVKQFKWIYTEVNRGQVYKGCAEIEDLDFYLGAYGFTRIETKWVGNWGDAIFIKDYVG